MTVCTVKKCFNTSGKQKKCDQITFHIFPIDPVIANRWIEIIRRNRKEDRWKPSKNTRICSMHFREKDKYSTKQGMRRIRRGAVPTKRLYLSSSESDSENTEDTKKPHDNKVCVEIKTERYLDSRPSTSLGQTSTVTTVLKPEPKHVKITSPNIGDKNNTVKIITEKTFHKEPEPDVHSSDLDSILYTPRELRLRRDLRRKTALQIKHARFIKTLKQKNLRLKKRNASLKQMLLTLKKQRFIDR